VVGKPVTILIPPDRLDEEPAILIRIARGERVDHFETVRRRKDGSLVEVSLTISPITDARGAITGASKIARDITERKQAEQQRSLLLREMNHRVKNLFALATGVVSLSARSQGTRQEVLEKVQERLRALARAHELTLPDLAKGGSRADAATTIGALLQAILSPFVDGGDGDDSHIVTAGPEVPVAGTAVASIALLLHEFATNAAKHGALSSPTGRVHVEWTTAAGEIMLTWRETNGPPLEGPPQSEGFGSRLVQGMAAQLGARVSREWAAEGLVILLSAPLERLLA
jgi:two-component sensor histidine kinase